MYRKASKYWDIHCPKIWTVCFVCTAIHSKDAYEMANSVDPDQTAPWALWSFEFYRMQRFTFSCWHRTHAIYWSWDLLCIPMEEQGGPLHVRVVWGTGSVSQLPWGASRPVVVQTQLSIRVLKPVASHSDTHWNWLKIGNNLHVLNRHRQRFYRNVYAMQLNCSNKLKIRASLWPPYEIVINW